MKYLFIIMLMTVSFSALSSEKADKGNGQFSTMTVSEYENSENYSGEENIKIDGSLERYIAYGFNNSPSLRAQFYRWRQHVYIIARSKRLPEPVISYSYFISSVETKTGPQLHKLSLKQSFPWPTSLTAKKNAAEQNTEAEAMKFEASAIELGSKIKESYYTLFALLKIKKLKEEHVVLLHSLSKSASAGVMTGTLDLSDLQQIDLTAAKEVDSIETLKEDIIQNKAALRALMGSNINLDVIIKTELYDFSLKESKDALLKKVLNHPFINSINYKALEAGYEKKEASLKRAPSFSVGIDWIITGKTNGSNVPDNGKDAVLAGVSMSIPLWQSNYKKEVESYRAKESALIADKENAENRARELFETLYSRLRDHNRKIDLYKNTLLPQAETVFDSVLGAYSSAKSNVASLILAQKDLLELRVSLINERAQSYITLARLENITGSEILVHKTTLKQQRDEE